MHKRGESDGARTIAPPNAVDKLGAPAQNKQQLQMSSQTSATVADHSESERQAMADALTVDMFEKLAAYLRSTLNSTTFLAVSSRLSLLGCLFSPGFSCCHQ